MDLDDCQQVQANRSGFALALLGSLAFVALGMWLLPVALWIGTASIIFFGVCVAFSAYKLLDKRPALILTRAELVNRSSLFAIPAVPWSEVTSAEIVPFGRQRLLVLRVRNAGSLLARQSPLVRAMQRANVTLTGSPVLIAGSALTMSLDELLVAVNSRIA